MSDVLFRYLLTARHRERSLWRRLVLAEDPLLEAGVEQLVETAAARAEVTSEHERVSMESVTVPASRHHTVRFYDVARPTRPRDGHFERRTAKFPLRATLRVYTCPPCGGAGRTRCGRCSGSGQVRCYTCGGSGRSDAGGQRQRCPDCGGDGRRTCTGCGGSGSVTCLDCQGEGRLASWDVEVYLWLIEERAEDVLPFPAEASRVLRAFHAWLEIDPERVASFEPDTVADHLGFETPAALGVARQADEHRHRLEDEARGSGDRYLFHRTDRSIAPVGYTVVRLDGKARFYWLVGRGDQAIEVTPRSRPDGVKCLGWLGLVWGTALAFEAVAGAAVPGQTLLEGVAAGGLSSWLVAGSAACWLLTLAAAHRVRRRRPPVPAVGLIVATGRPTAYLTCLAYLGSYLGRLTVLDRAYDAQTRRLMGRMRSRYQSESLGIELADGRRLRLIEMANTRDKSADQMRLMARALDAVMILETPEHTAADLLAEVSIAAPALTVGTATIDDRLDLDDPGAALPLEAVRRAFVEDFSGDVDWRAQFERMWRPLAELVEHAELSKAAGEAPR